MDYLKIAQRVDLLIGFVFLAGAIYTGATHHYLWSLGLTVSSVLSFLSAKYTPAKWVLRKVLLAQLK